jgi:Glycosyl transferase family group 2
VRVDPEWLTYLVQAFCDSQIGVAGGPAIVPDDDPWFAQCVARAPGAPTPVLLDDRIAEHVPGCNCAFRTDALAAIGGFNPLFRRAGDDVDVCWRMQAQGWKIGFAPAALAWHRHRASTSAYWRQQIGYGEGETWLMREHPDKFVRGRIDWHGHIYSPLPFLRSLRTTRINSGPFGTAGFPSVYRTDAKAVSYLPHSGRWQIAWIVTLAAALAALLAGSWFAVPLLAAAVAALSVTVIKCAAHGFRSDVDQLPPISRYSRASSRIIYRFAIAWLHFVQPFARLSGRVRGLVNRPEAHARSKPGTAERVDAGLSLRDIADAFRLFLSLPAERSYWSESWVELAGLLRALADRLRQQRAVSQIEIDSGWWEDRDLTVVRQGWFRLDVRALVEDHGGGRCLQRFAVHSRLTTAAALPLLIAIATAGMLRYTGVSWFVAIAIVASTALLIAARGVLAASRLIFRALDAVATGLGMAVLPPYQTARPVAADSRAVPAEPAGLMLTDRDINEATAAERAFVGDG